MIQDQEKTKEELIAELAAARRSVARYEAMVEKLCPPGFSAASMGREGSSTEALRRYRWIADQVHDVIWMTDRTGAIDYFSSSVRRLLGYTPAELKEMAWKDLIAPAFFAIFQEALRRRITLETDGEGDEKTRRWEAEWIRKDGKPIPTETVTTPVRDGDGNFLGIIGVTRDISDRKRVEADLGTCEDRFRLFMDNSPTLAWIKEETGRYVFLSRNHEDFGFRVEESLGKRVEEIFPPAIAAMYRENDLRVTAAGRPMEMVEESVDQTGERRFWRVQKFPFQDPEGNRFIGGIGVDITDRRRLEEALRKSEETFRKVTEAAPTNIFILRGGRFVYVNPTFLEVTGYTAEEVRNLNFLNLIHPDFRNLVRERVRARQEGDAAPWRKELRNLTKAGESLWLDHSSVLIEYEGTPAILGISVDITARKCAEAALRESENRYRTLLEGVTDSVYVLDSDWNHLLVNEAAHRFTGTPSGGLLGKNLLELFPNVEGTPFFESFQRVMEKREPEVVESEFRFLHGGKGWYEVNVYPVPEGILCISKDITDRKLAEGELEAARQAAEAASRAKSEFIANMSHELRTPLNAILGYGQILGRDDSLSGGHREKIDIMTASGRHLLTLIEDILDIARIESGKIEIEPRAVDLKRMVANVAAMLRLRALEKAVDLVQEIDPATPRYVECDEKRLRQVLLNLLSNAVKFTDEGRVTISVRPAGGRIAFRVSDTGIGIPEESLQEIFEPFRQLFGVSGRREGTGLGLSISRRLVRLMGGDIEARSTVGEGSVFAFAIPLPELDAQAAPPEAERPKKIVGHRGPRRRALIVDDMEINRVIARAMLEPLGFDIEEARDGGEAIDIRAAFRPDVILVDLVLPDMDGTDLIRALRAGDLGSAPLILVVSGKGHWERERVLREGSVDAYLTKPISYDDLVDLLGRGLGLTWIHESDEAAEGTGRGGEPLPLTPPSTKDLTALHALSRMGDLSAIRDYLDDIRRCHPEAAAFCAAAGRHVRACDTTAIRNLIEGFMGEKV